MKIFWIPNDIVKLVEVWLTERFFYVEIDNARYYSIEWSALNFNQILMTRQTNFITRKEHVKRSKLTHLLKWFNCPSMG